MTEAAANTKVEALAEGIENLCIAICSDALQKVHGQDHKKIRQALQSAQLEVRDALREFVRPVFRVLNPHQPYPSDTPEDDKVLCYFCKKFEPCREQCLAWGHSVQEKLKAVREGVDAKIAAGQDPTRDDDPPEAA